MLNYTKELQIPRKDRIAICCWDECRKAFNFCWRSKAGVTNLYVAESYFLGTD